ncbi:MAG TPA: DinB family protein [Candidatus Deferrimicrobium sp.]|nr:DinB family protein [Candidatus Deferrimicrobium sp.]
MIDRSGIDTMLYLLDEAFRGVGIEQSNESQALLPNLSSVPDDAWHRLPEGAARSIEAIAVHTGACKLMYANHAFGDGSLRFGTPAVEPWRSGEAEMADVLPWLERVHEGFVDHVAALADDAELAAPRHANWGELRPTRWLIAAMITHDAYHAGEVNHLRSLMGGDDRWRFEQLGFG